MERVTTPEDTVDPPSTRRLERRGPAVLLGLLYVLATAVYSALAHQSPIPLILPDEVTYGSLAQSVAAGDGLTIRGVEAGLRSPLYVYMISPAWKLASGNEAFEIAQTMGAALLCLTVVPVWSLAKHYVGGWVALVPALLVVSGSWMLTAAGLLTENVGLPLSAAALGATVLAVTRPGSRWTWAAIGFALVAALARAQLAVIIVIIVMSVVLDCARYGRDWRERLDAHRVLASLSGGILLAGIIALGASPHGVLGIYDGIGGSPDAGDAFWALKDQLTGLLAMSAVLPVVIVAAASVRADVWRDDHLGPLLAVTWSTVLLLLVQSAWALTGVIDNARLPWHIQRYVEYAVPMLLVTMTVVISWRRTMPLAVAAAGAIATLVLLATPGVRNAAEERGLFGLQERLISALGTPAGVSWALVATLLVTGAALASVRLRKRPTAFLGVVSAMMLVTFVVQAQVLWPWQDRITNSWRAGFPANLSWIDDDVQANVSRMVVAANPQRGDITQFFNHQLDSVFTPNTPIGGRPLRDTTCPWTLTDAGVVDWSVKCDPPRNLLLDDDFAKVQFFDQTVLAAKPEIGRVVQLGTQPARVKSILRVPCGPPLPAYDRGGRAAVKRARQQCTPVLFGATWLDEAGDLVLRFRGGAKPARVSFGDRAATYAVRPRAVTTIRRRVPAGPWRFDAKLDWSGAGPRHPELIGAELVESDGSRTDLLY